MTEEHPHFIKSIHDPRGRLSHVIEQLRPAVKKSGRFALAIGSTETSDIEGISAAGADAEARRITPALDAEALVLGSPLTAYSVPVSPDGIVSPVVASRAMVNLLNCKIEVYDCGAFVAPKLELLRVGLTPARSLDSGMALDFDAVERLFEQGQKAGKALAQAGSYIVVGECVPAGTITALGVLTALGYPADKLVSSSLPANDHQRRSKLVESGIRNSGCHHKFNVKESPLRAVSAVGDPMQPFVAGLMLAASSHVPVVLGGGTQMLAVYALARAIAGDAALSERAVAIVTTKWVAFDTLSDPGQLARLVDAPFAASCPNFAASRHEGLRAYELGNVKEGVGLGAMMALVHLAGFSPDRICETVDLQYDRMVLARRSS
jgi:uncharacterized protein (TIGR00303 family)